MNFPDGLTTNSYYLFLILHFDEREGAREQRAAILVVLLKRFRDRFDSDPQPRDLLFRSKLFVAPIVEFWLKSIEIWRAICFIIRIKGIIIRAAAKEITFFFIQSM